VRIATANDAVILLLHRPGQFVVAGEPLARVWPEHAVAAVTKALTRAHIVGSNRTLTQDPGFAIDQLVEIAIRALSPAVNDTFTALNCIDWLGHCLCFAATERQPDGLFRDDAGVIRVIDPALPFERLVRKSFDKIRQAGRGMPAVLIRQLENLQKVARAVGPNDDSIVLAHEAEMILRASAESVPEASDRQDILVAYEGLMAGLGGS
jgi:uncharacterized membrane protein